MVSTIRIRHVRTANEQGVTSEDCTVVAIFEQIANAVLRVAWSVKSLDLDAIANGERLAMARCLGDFIAIPTADDGERVALQDFSVSTSMVVMAVL